MSIVRLVNGEKVVFANKSITNHNQLQGTTDYGCHPIRAIRDLPEKLSTLKEADLNLNNKLNEIELKSAVISLKENKELNSLEFTNFNNEKSLFRQGLPADEKTLTSENNILAVKQIYVDNNQFSGKGTELEPIELNTDNVSLKVENKELRVKGITNLDNTDVITYDIINRKASTLDSEIKNLIDEQDVQDTKIAELEHRIKGVGGYLDENNFGSAKPTNEQLNKYAIEQLPDVTRVEEIPDQTKVKNMFNNHTWVFDKLLLKWVDNGLENIAIGNEEFAGVVKSSKDGEFLGKIDLHGYISINGLSEFRDATNKTLGEHNTKIELIGKALDNTTTITKLNEELNKKFDKVGGTISGDVLLDKRLPEPDILREPSITFATYDSITPYIGYSKTKHDGTFVIGSIGNNNDENFDDTKNSLTFTAQNDLKWKNKKVLTEAEGVELWNHMSSELDKKASQQQVTDLSILANGNDQAIQLINTILPDKANTAEIEEQLGTKANTQYVTEQLEKKANKVKVVTVTANNWETLEQKEPYKFKSIVALPVELKENSIVELYNDNPILFATYGLMIGEISNNLATIYCIKSPSTTLTLKIGVQE